ncbi:MAG TPA: endo alpha-1,4 polygalactosaminidase [Bacilli bacterium]|nr:endo alpha-1,4 polygalactosaminidase [Bacilli bacterium]
MMKRRLVSLLSLSLSVALSLGVSNTAYADSRPAVSQAQAVAATALLEDVQTYTIFYGEPTPSALRKLSRYDLVVVEPRLWSASQVQQVRAKGVRVYGYLSVLEQHESSTLLAQAQAEDFLEVEGERDYRTLWNSWSMNINADHYRSLLLQDYREQILDKRLDGVFLDTVGNVDDEIWPQNVSDRQRDGVVTFIQALHDAHPDKGIVQNWGVETLKDRTAASIDGILWEDFDHRSAAEDEWTQDRLAELDKLRLQNGLRVFTVRIGASGRDKSAYLRWNKRHGYVGTVIADSYDRL